MVDKTDLHKSDFFCYKPQNNNAINLKFLLDIFLMLNI